MKRIRKRDILTGIIANIAIINLVLLFGFEYEVFGFSWAEFYTRKFSDEPVVTASTADTAEQTAEAATEEQAAAVAITGSAADDKEDKTGTAATSEEMTTADGASTAETTVAEENVKKCRVVSAKNARIRSGPGTEHERVASVPRDTVLTVLDVEENGWVHVRTDDGTEGYISGDLIEMIDEE